MPCARRALARLPRANAMQISEDAMGHDIGCVTDMNVLMCRSDRFLFEYYAIPPNDHDCGQWSMRRRGARARGRAGCWFHWLAIGPAGVRVGAALARCSGSCAGVGLLHAAFHLTIFTLDLHSWWWLGGGAIWCPVVTAHTLHTGIQADSCPIYNILFEKNGNRARAACTVPLSVRVRPRPPLIDA